MKAEPRTVINTTFILFKPSVLQKLFISLKRIVYRKWDTCLSLSDSGGSKGE